MIDPTPHEQAAMVAGGDAAGAYLESLGRADLTVLSPSEWRQFIEIVVSGYCDRLRHLADHDETHIGDVAERAPF